MLQRQSVSKSRFAPLTFDEWKYEVNRACENLCGLSADDLPNYDFQMAYRSGKSAQQTAKAVIRAAKDY